MVTDKEGAGHVSQLLRVLVGQLHRGRVPVRDNVIHEGSPTGAGIAQPHDLNGSRTQDENFVTRALRVAVHVDQNVNAVAVDRFRRLGKVRLAGQIDKVLRFGGDFRAECSLIVNTQRVTKHLKTELNQVKSIKTKTIKRNRNRNGCRTKNGNMVAIK